MHLCKQSSAENAATGSAPGKGCWSPEVLTAAAYLLAQPAAVPCESDTHARTRHSKLYPAELHLPGGLHAVPKPRPGWRQQARLPS